MVNASPTVPLPLNAVLIHNGHPYFKEIDTTLKPSQGGPGMFVSRKDPATGKFRLYAMPVPVTRVARDPVNEERTIDVPLQDDQGRILYQLDPAARTTIALANDGDQSKDSIPTTEFPDAKDAMASGLEVFQKSMAEQAKTSTEQIAALHASMIENQKASDERMEKLIAALVGAKGKG